MHTPKMSMCVQASLNGHLSAYVWNLNKGETTDQIFSWLFFQKNVPPM